MKLELFVHGVPKGQSIWGKNDDHIYIQNFYTSRNDETRFLVQVRDVKGERYCYYSYLKYNNIAAFDGRPGAYFGLSLRLDAYCLDVIGIYNILETIYKRYIVGNILNYEKTKSKFLISDFQSKDDDLKKIQEHIISLIKLSLLPNDFISLKDFVFSGSNSIMEVNLIDCTKENVLSVISENSALAISPFYPTIKDKNTKKQIEEQLSLLKKTQEENIAKLQLDNESKIKNCKEEVRLFQQKNEELNEALQKSINDMQILSSENSRLKQVVEENKKNSDVQKTVATLREPLTKLAKLVGQEDTSYELSSTYRYKETDSWWEKTRKIVLPILHTILLLAIVLYCSFCVSNSQSNKKGNTISKTSVVALEKEIQKVSTDSLHNGNLNVSNNDSIQIMQNDKNK